MKQTRSRRYYKTALEQIIHFAKQNESKVTIEAITYSDGKTIYYLSFPLLDRHLLGSSIDGHGDSPEAAAEEAIRFILYNSNKKRICESFNRTLRNLEIQITKYFK